MNTSRHPWTIQSRLLIGFGSLVVVSLAASLASIQTIYWLSGGIRRALGEDVQRAGDTGRMQALFARMDSAQHGLVLFTMMGDSAHASKAAEDFRTSSDEAAKVISATVGVGDSEETRVALRELETRRAEWSRHFQQLATACGAGNCSEALAWMFEQGFNNTTRMNTLADNAALRLRRAGDAEVARMSRSVGWRSALLVGLTIFAGVVGVFVLVSIRDATTRLRALARVIAAGSSELTPVTERLAASSGSLAGDASRGSTSVDQLAGLTQSIAEKTQAAARSAATVSELATDTGTQVERANQAVADLTRSMDALVGDSRRIATITKSTEEIAFRTNMLALNAAVEAARAGAAGASFAVVAEEVRSLAGSSAKAARETAELIDATIASCRTGQERLQLVDASIREITVSTGKVKELSGEVTARTRDQSEAVASIAQGLVEIRDVTRATATTAQNMADGGDALSNHVKELEDQVADLHSLVG